jgi:hypothetical protein
VIHLLCNGLLGLGIAVTMCIVGTFIKEVSFDRRPKAVVNVARIRNLRDFSCHMSICKPFPVFENSTLFEKSSLFENSRQFRALSSFFPAPEFLFTLRLILLTSNPLSQNLFKSHIKSEIN